MIGTITQVWTEIMTWVTTSLGQVQDVFYTVGADGAAGELTFLGVLAVISVAIGIVFLLIGVIQNFLHLRS